jgi:hypothetical protein
MASGPASLGSAFTGRLDRVNVGALTFVVKFARVFDHQNLLYDKFIVK